MCWLLRTRHSVSRWAPIQYTYSIQVNVFVYILLGILSRSHTNNTLPLTIYVNNGLCYWGEGPHTLLLPGLVDDATCCAPHCLSKIIVYGVCIGISADVAESIASWIGVVGAELWLTSAMKFCMCCRCVYGCILLLCR